MGHSLPLILSRPREKRKSWGRNMRYSRRTVSQHHEVVIEVVRESAKENRLELGKRMHVSLKKLNILARDGEVVPFDDVVNALSPCNAPKAAAATKIFHFECCRIRMFANSLLHRYFQYFQSVIKHSVFVFDHCLYQKQL